MCKVILSMLFLASFPVPELACYFECSGIVFIVLIVEKLSSIVTTLFGF